MRVNIDVLPEKSTTGRGSLPSQAVLAALGITSPGVGCGSAPRRTGRRGRFWPGRAWRRPSGGSWRRANRAHRRFSGRGGASRCRRDVGISSTSPAGFANRFSRSETTAPFGASLELFDAGVAARTFDRDDFEQVLDSERQGAEAVDQFGGETVAPFRLIYPAGRFSVISQAPLAGAVSGSQIHLAYAIAAEASMSETLSIELEDEVRRALDRLVQQSARSVDDIVNQAVRDYLDVQQWQQRKIEAGIAAADRGEFATEDEIARIAAKYSKRG